MSISSVTIGTISPDTGSSSTDFITDAASFGVSGTANVTSITGGTSTWINVFATIGTTHIYLGSYHFTSTGGAVAWSLPASATLPADGTYTIQAYRSTASTSTWPGGTAQGTHTVTLDTVAPVVTSAIVALDEHITTTVEESSFTVTGAVTGTAAGTVSVGLYNSLNVLVYSTTGTIVANGANGTYSVTFTGDHFPAGSYTAKVTATDVAGNVSGIYSQIFDSTVCFMAGTQIRTPDGDVAVEKLAIGQPVTLADGRTLPVKWIGHQIVALRFADPLKSAPICIKAGALDENVPSRDLYTSSGHAMLLDGNLVIAGAMVNGTSVVRVTPETPLITYYHVELDEHAVIFANDAATESFVDNMSRATFANYDAYVKLYPNATSIPEMGLPLVKSARQLPAATRAHLAARARAIADSKVAAA